MNRLKEIGVRKSMGAHRHQVFFQFFIESLILGILAFFISFILIILSQELLTWQQIELPGRYYLSVPFIGILGLSTLITCMISGVLIAFSLSKISVIKGLKGSLLKGSKGMRLQKLLLGLQFFIAFVTLMAASTFNSQNNYLINSDLGYNHEGIIVVKNIEKISESTRAAIQNKVTALSSVTSKGFSYHIPNSNSEAIEFRRAGFGDPTEKLVFSVLSAEDSFLETYGLKILAQLSSNQQAIEDSLIMINENAMRQMGLFNPSEVIGKKISLNSKVLTINGVVADFHFENLYTEVKPLVLLAPSALPEPPLNEYKFLSVRAENSSTPPHLLLEKIWKETESSVPFNYSYLSTHLSQSYKEDRQLGKLVNIASIIAITIALLGLLSMSQVIFNVKIKEISIRKVLGAGLSRLYQHFIYQFLLPLLIAFVIAVPLVIWYMGLWLNKFAYRITLKWELFAGSGIILLILAISVLTINATRAAFMNPVDNLRSE